MVDCVFLCLAFHLVTRPESLALGRVYFLPGTCACWGASGGQSHRRASQALVKPQKASWSSLSGSANSQGSLSEGASAHQGSLSPQPSLLVSTRNILFQRRLPGTASRQVCGWRRLPFLWGAGAAPASTPVDWKAASFTFFLG